MAETQQALEGRQAQAPGHEQNVVNLPTIVKLGLGLLAVTVVSFVLMGWLFEHFAVQQEKLDIAPSPLTGARQLPPQPRLQIVPAEALKEMQQANEARLHSYAWIDRQSGLVRIPIERAMEVLAERGLPARRETPQTE